MYYINFAVAFDVQTNLHKRHNTQLHFKTLKDKHIFTEVKLFIYLYHWITALQLRKSVLKIQMESEACCVNIFKLFT